MYDCLFNSIHQFMNIFTWLVTFVCVINPGLRNSRFCSCNQLTYRRQLYKDVFVQRRLVHRLFNFLGESSNEARCVERSPFWNQPKPLPLGFKTHLSFLGIGLHMKDLRDSSCRVFRFSSFRVFGFSGFRTRGVDIQILGD